MTAPATLRGHPTLRDYDWRLKYTPENGDLVAGLYVPALRHAVRYDRLTGYFQATALALAARGLEGLVGNDGHMRMVVGCTLDQAEVDAIARGEALRDRIAAKLEAAPLLAPDAAAQHGLGLLAWLVARGRLEIKVAVPCDAQRRPVAGAGLFHEKAGIIEDAAGNRIAFNGSLNESAAGWTLNWDSLNVFTSWRDPERMQEEDANFALLWAGRATRALVLDIPAALRADLLRFLPDTDPVRHRPAAMPASAPPEASAPAAAPFDARRAVWSFIAQAASMPLGGARVGEATAAVTPWPHQLRAFHRMYDAWPPRLLIADEVGLGKTVQAGLLLRQAWMAGRAKRILVLAPKAVTKQWQVELREKFNLNWPIYDGQKLSWYPSPGMQGRSERLVSRAAWHEQPALIASSHLLRRRDREAEMLHDAAPWDLVVLDEAHHARRRGAGSAAEGGPNNLLRLMRGLRSRTDALVLLTATPMQVHPVEVFDLLDLLGLPPAWTQEAFLRFFDEGMRQAPSHEVFERMAALFRAVEAHHGLAPAAGLDRAGLKPGLQARRVLSALRDASAIPRRQLGTADRNAALQLMRQQTPVSRLVSRHTRDLLRRYHAAGKISTRIADRDVEDRFLPLSPAEREVYEAVDEYVSTTWNQASDTQRSAIGFVMTIYRRRLASSFHALRCTLEKHLLAMRGQKGEGAQADLEEALDDADDEAERDADEASRLEREALALEEAGQVDRLQAMISRLPTDTKAACLRETVAQLRKQGYGQVMVFTQFTDTMDFLRGLLLGAASPGGTALRVMCFSGRGGEVPASDGSWRTVSRDDVKARFRAGEADVLLCTDAAAEGLNFQFCGALVNYDMPWNPIRVEQRIGRIDRLGQGHARIRIINLHYADTVEADIYAALRDRIGLFQKVVGRLQPILSRLPALISSRVLSGSGRSPQGRRDAVGEVLTEAERLEAAGGFDIDAVTDGELDEPAREATSMALVDLGRVLCSAGLLPPAIESRPLGAVDRDLLMPGMAKRLRVTTDAAFYEANADSVELWSPGSPLFPDAAALAAGTADELAWPQLASLLDEADKAGRRASHAS